jgi:type IV secretion system protein VirB10
VASGRAGALQLPNVRFWDPTALHNCQDQKEAFLAKVGDAATRSAGTLQAPAAPSTVMAGTVIPAALVTGINSDLPGDRSLHYQVGGSWH